MSLTKIGQGQYVINASGVYELSVDDTNATNNPFLTIAADYVTVRLRGRFEGNLGVNSGASAIYAVNRAQVTILGEGVLLRGFRYGVNMQNCFRTTIRELGLLDMTKAGIMHTGNDLVCTNNQLKNIGGGSGTDRVYGIRSAGTFPTIIGNVIREVFNPYEEAVGISSDNHGDKGIIMGNSLTNSSGPGGLLPNGLPNKWGIWVGGVEGQEPDVDVVHNHLNGWYVCYGLSSPTDGMVDENTQRNYVEFSRNTGNWQLGGVDG